MRVRYCDANTASWTFDGLEVRSKRHRASRTCFSVSFRPPLLRTSSHFCHSISAVCKVYVYHQHTRPVTCCSYPVQGSSLSNFESVCDLGATTCSSPCRLDLLLHLWSCLRSRAETRLALPATRLHTHFDECHCFTLMEYCVPITVCGATVSPRFKLRAPAMRRRSGTRTRPEHDRCGTDG